MRRNFQMRRPGTRSGRGLPPNVLYLPMGGTFTRTSEASGLIAAPTDGTLPFLKWWLAGERRIEDRGDGFGPMLLMEGSRTNLILYCRDLTQASYNAGLTVITTAADEEGPDGVLTATRSQVTADGYARYRSIGTLTGRYTGSIWTKRKRGTGAGPIQASLPQFGGTAGIGGPYVNAALGETYIRPDASITGDGVAAEFLLPADARAGGPFTSRALDVESDLLQLEAGYFPSSAIRTTTVQVTRAAESLIYAVGQYPDSFRTSGFYVDVVPDFSSADVISSGLTFKAVYCGTNNALWITVGAGVAQVELWVAGSRIAFKIITFSRYQRMRLTAEPSLGRLTVSGATTGDGSITGAGGAWSGTLYIGADNVGGGNWFGRLGPTLVGL